MASKKLYNLPQIGDVYIQRRKGMRNIRLRIDNDLRVIITMPRWISVRQALKFASSKADWITHEKAKHDERPKSQLTIANDNYVLRVNQSDSSRPSISRNSQDLVINIKIPAGYTDAMRQSYIK